MIDLTNIKSVYLYTGNTDFRLGINSLTALISSEFKGNLNTHTLFLFCNKRRTQVKVLEFDDVGIWLYVKKLHKGQFPYPDNKQGRYEITTKNLEIILSGLDFICQIQNENKQYKYY